MSPEDETELYRLADMLEQIDHTLPNDSKLREALYKAGLSLSFSFLDGRGPDIEEGYLNRNAGLSSEQREHLKSLGIDPDED